MAAVALSVYVDARSAPPCDAGYSGFYRLQLQRPGRQREVCLVEKLDEAQAVWFWS